MPRPPKRYPVPKEYLENDNPAVTKNKLVPYFPVPGEIFLPEWAVRGLILGLVREFKMVKDEEYATINLLECTKVMSELLRKAPWDIESPDLNPTGRTREEFIADNVPGIIQNIKRKYEHPPMALRMQANSLLEVLKIWEFPIRPKNTSMRVLWVDDKLERILKLMKGTTEFGEKVLKGSGGICHKKCPRRTAPPKGVVRDSFKTITSLVTLRNQILAYQSNSRLPSQHFSRYCPPTLGRSTKQSQTLTATEILTSQASQSLQSPDTFSGLSLLKNPPLLFVTPFSFWG